MQIASTFKRVGIRFFHAENLHDFAVYCDAKALLTRCELERRSTGFTRFYSDATDKKLGVDRRVFGNIRDFGALLGYGRNTIPNVYGPITLVFASSAFDHMSDITITQKSVVTLKENWRRLAASPAMIDHIASGSASDYHVARDWTFAELSCAESSLSFSLLERIIVEPIKLRGGRLVDHVRAELQNKSLGHVAVDERAYSRADNLRSLSALVTYCENLPSGLSAEDPTFDDVVSLPEWSDRDAEKKKRLVLWARYFYAGTVAESKERAFQAMMDAADAADTREPCGACDPGEDSSPAMVSFGPLYTKDGRSGLMEEGYCDRCNTLSLKCLRCGVVEPVFDGMCGSVRECSGCDLMFLITRTGGYESDVGYEVTFPGAMTRDELEEQLGAAIQSKYEDHFVQAVAEDDYPVCEIELDDLRVEMNAEDPGTADITWGFSASHPSGGFGFGGVVTGKATYDATAATPADLKDSLRVSEVRADFDMGDPDDDGPDEE